MAPEMTYLPLPAGRRRLWFRRIMAASIPTPGLTRAELRRARRAESAGTWGSGLVVVLAAWFCSRILVGATWAPARDPFTLMPSAWFHWDSHNYYMIALNGRTFGRCGSPGFPATAFVRFFHEKWCGTAAWLPGYAWLLDLVHLIGIDRRDAGLIVSSVAVATAMFLVWVGWCRDLHPGRALLVLISLGVFPGAVYNFAFFPTSLALAFVVGAALAATRDRFFVGAVLMTFAGLCYPSAWFAAAGLMIGLALLSLSSGFTMCVRRVLWGVAGLGAIALLAIHDQLVYGYLDAYVKEQTQTPQPPWSRAFLDLFTGTTVEQLGLRPRIEGALLAVQVVIAMGITFGSSLVAFASRCFSQWEKTLIYPATIGVGVVAGVLFVSNISAWNRSIVLAAPCVVCLKRLPIFALITLTICMSVVTSLISYAFFNGSMV